MEVYEGDGRREKKEEWLRHDIYTLFTYHYYDNLVMVLWYLLLLLQCRYALWVYIIIMVLRILFIPF